LWKVKRNARDGAFGLKRKNEQPLFLELVAQTGFAVGDVHAFDDFPVGRCEPAAKFHSALKPPSRQICRDCINFGTISLKCLDRAAPRKAGSGCAVWLPICEGENSRDVVSRLRVRRNAVETLYCEIGRAS